MCDDPPSGDDEWARLCKTPMRGLVHSAPRRSSSPGPAADTLVQLAPNSAALPPPIAWLSIAELSDSAPAPEPQAEPLGSDGSADSDPIDRGPLSKHERAGPEWRAHREKITSTRVVRHLGQAYRVPVIEQRRPYIVQRSGSNRVHTRDVMQLLREQKAVRQHIEAGKGVPDAVWRKLGSTVVPAGNPSPSYHIAHLPRYAVPDALDVDRVHELPGEYGLCVHSERVPPRRPLAGHAMVLLGAIPHTAVSAGDKAALRATQNQLPVKLDVARMPSGTVHPGLSPVDGFELYADTPAGRSLAAASPWPVTDFIVTKSGQVLGSVDFALVLGQTVPKTPPLGNIELETAAKQLYHNWLLDTFFPNPYAAPVTLSAAEVVWKNDTLLKPAAQQRVLLNLAYAVDGRYAIKPWAGRPVRSVVSDTAAMQCHAVRAYEQSTAESGCSRRANPRGVALAMHAYIRGDCYLQVGGQAASSPLSVSPLTLPLKAPVRQSAGLGDSVPRCKNGRNEVITRFPPRETEEDQSSRAIQGTSADQRKLDREAKLRLCAERLADGSLSQEDWAKLHRLQQKLLGTRGKPGKQSNGERWEMINLLFGGKREKVNQGTVRRDGLQHAVDRNSHYLAEVFRAYTTNLDACDIVYPTDTRGVPAHHRIEFTEWVDKALVRAHLHMSMQFSDGRTIRLSSNSTMGWGADCTLNEEQKLVVIRAVEWYSRITAKRRVRWQLQRELTDPAASVRCIDDQIAELRRKIRGLGGLSDALKKKLCR